MSEARWNVTSGVTVCFRWVQTNDDVVFFDPLAARVGVSTEYANNSGRVMTYTVIIQTRKCEFYVLCIPFIFKHSTNMDP